MFEDKGRLWLTVVVGPCVFFFQAEDGIRDYKVTGVQTCALPICPPVTRSFATPASSCRLGRTDCTIPIRLCSRPKPCSSNCWLECSASSAVGPRDRKSVV